MAHVRDNWHKTRAAADEPRCAEHGMVPSEKHGRGKRWQARWRDGARELKLNFSRRVDAERHVSRLGAAWCIVPKCGSSERPLAAAFRTGSPG